MRQNLQLRKGKGLEESGEGMYYVDDVAYYTFVEQAGKIKLSRMDHTYTKTRVAAENLQKTG